MNFHVTHRLGDMEEASRSVFPALLQELEVASEDKVHIG